MNYSDFSSTDSFVAAIVSTSSFVRVISSTVTEFDANRCCRLGGLSKRRRETQHNMGHAISWL